MIKAQFIGKSIISNSSEAFSLYEKSKYGEKTEGSIGYSSFEALFMVNTKKMEIYAGDKKLSFEKLINRMKRVDKNISLKLIVFSDLRKKGYIVKSALKFGADFRVYDKGAKPDDEHAKWLLFVAKENEALKLHDFAAKNRVAHSTRKKMLLAIVDEDGGVLYYEVGWMKL